MRRQLMPMTLLLISSYLLLSGTAGNPEQARMPELAWISLILWLLGLVGYGKVRETGMSKDGSRRRGNTLPERLKARASIMGAGEIRLNPRRILLVGAMGSGRSAVNGEQVKNRLLAGWLESRHRLVRIDTDGWKRRPWVMGRILIEMLWGRHDTILVSASSASVHTLFRVIRPFRGARARILYLVIGGYLPTGIRFGRYRVSSYAGLKGLIVEGDALRRQLHSLGIGVPLHVIPNVKPIGRLHGSAARYACEGPTRFLFLGRMAETKGTLAVMRALGHRLLRNRARELQVDFYGTLEAEHRDDFLIALSHHACCTYKGYLDVTNDPKGAYDTISGYHGMLFPTHWMGEGFPGVILDAYLCGVPVIATDWNMNRDVVQDGVTGRLIPAGDPAALAAAMTSVMDDRGEWARMSRNCHEAVLRFELDSVLRDRLEPLLQTT
jgi:glycosyltransferase involved in cell wall biosynthesis